MKLYSYVYAYLNIDHFIYYRKIFLDIYFILKLKINLLVSPPIVIYIL